MYLLIRALHVVCGGIWLGVAVFGALWLIPMTSDLGPDAAKVAASLRKRGYIAAIPVIAMVGILSGIWLYWRFTGGFSPEVVHTHSAMAFGTGGALAIIAFLIGALMISRSMVRATKLMTEAASASNDTDRRRLMGAANVHRSRADLGVKVVAVLVTVTTILMAIGHYV